MFEGGAACTQAGVPREQVQDSRWWRTGSRPASNPPGAAISDTKYTTPHMPHHAPAATAIASARDLIAAHGGRVTRTRVAVIEALQTSSHPLSHDEIGAALAADGIAHDRVTLYRALDWLVEQGIAQRIAGGERASIARQSRAPPGQR